MTTQAQIQTLNNFPVSTSTSVLLANERREQLNADIDAFLAAGGKITVINRPVIKPEPVEKLFSFNGKPKEYDIWQNRAKYAVLVKKHNIKTKTIADMANISPTMVLRYLQCVTRPRLETIKKLESVIDQLCGA